jgi:hypothetical protein
MSDNHLPKSGMTKATSVIAQAKSTPRPRHELGPRGLEQEEIRLQKKSSLNEDCLSESKHHPKSGMTKPTRAFAQAKPTTMSSHSTSSFPPMKGAKIDFCCHTRARSTRKKTQHNS